MDKKVVYRTIVASFFGMVALITGAAIIMGLNYKAIIIVILSAAGFSLLGTTVLFIILKTLSDGKNKRSYPKGFYYDKRITNH